MLYLNLIENITHNICITHYLGRLATKHTKNTQNAQVDKNENKIKAQIEAEETKKEENTFR